MTLIGLRGKTITCLSHQLKNLPSQDQTDLIRKINQDMDTGNVKDQIEKRVKKSPMTVSQPSSAKKGTMWVLHRPLWHQHHKLRLKTVRNKRENLSNQKVSNSSRYNERFIHALWRSTILQIPTTWRKIVLGSYQSPTTPHWQCGY